MNLNPKKLNSDLLVFLNAFRHSKNKLFVPAPFNVFEWVALVNGLKPALSMKFSAGSPAIKLAEKAAKKNSFCFMSSPVKYINNSNLSVLEPVPLEAECDADVLVCVSRDKSDAEKTIKSYGFDAVKYGEAMGYPRCCIDFGRTLSGNPCDPKNISGDFLWARARTRCYRNSSGFNSLLNVFNGLSVIPHVPCSLECKKSIDYANSVLKVLNESSPGFVGLVRDYLSLPSLYWNYSDFVLFDGELRGNKLEFSSSLKCFNSLNYFSSCPDAGLAQKLEEHYSLVSRGDSIEMLSEKLNVFNGKELIGSIQKQRPYELLLTRAGQKPIRF